MAISPKKLLRFISATEIWPLGVSISPQSLLSNIFEHGAKPHKIGDAGALLSNYNRTSRGEPAFAARGPVKHPGMAAHPFIGPVFDRSHPAAQRAFAKVLFEGIT